MIYLFLFLLFISVLIYIYIRSQTDWRTSIILEGLHISNTLKTKADYNESYSFIFTESCRYDLKNKDQHDWNKLFGISEDINNHKVSMMWAWRYDLDKKKIELMPYQHDFKIFPGSILNRSFYSDNISAIEIGEEVKLEIKNHISDWEVSINNKVVLFVKKTSLKPPFCFRIFNWFGGNRVAPVTIKIKYKKND